MSSFMSHGCDKKKRFKIPTHLRDCIDTFCEVVCTVKEGTGCKPKGVDFLPFFADRHHAKGGNTVANLCIQTRLPVASQCIHHPLVGVGAARPRESSAGRLHGTPRGNHQDTAAHFSHCPTRHAPICNYFSILISYWRIGKFRCITHY
jgi:hypothetical protein